MLLRKFALILINKTVTFVFQAFFLVFAAGAQEPRIEAFLLPNARAAGMGGFHAALTDDFSSAFNNPAGFAAISKKKSVTEFSYELNNIDMMYNIFYGELSDEEMFKYLQGRVEGNFVMGGPLSFGCIDNGFGWRCFNVSRLNIIWDRNVVFLLNPRASEEFLFSAGYGARLADSGDSTLDAGAAVKAFYRLLYAPNGIYLQEIKHILAEIGEKNFISQFGCGIDAGLRWTKNDMISFALVCRDLFSPAYITHYRTINKYIKQEMYDASVETIKPCLSAGFSWRLKSPIMHHWNTDLIINADYHGVLELFEKSDISPALLFAAGLELRFLEVVSVRAGWSDWLPCGGFGINFTAFQLDFSLSGKEYGKKPGMGKTVVADLCFLFQY
jgi:hypothetical protein